MNKERNFINIDPKIKYLPSEPCTCEICVNYCKRPGWWTLEEANAAIQHGLAMRMMLEISPERDFAVLSPAFKGNECNFAYQIFAQNGCTFLNNGLCELFGTGLQPLECRYCHHSRKGLGIKCHLEIGMQWNSPEGKRLIVSWGNHTGFWQKQGILMFEK
jgi:hypothetical protein